MVNWGKYDSMRRGTDQREYNRLKQREYRAKKSEQECRKEDKAAGVNGRNEGQPLPGERAYVKAVEDGTELPEPSESIADKVVAAIKDLST